MGTTVDIEHCTEMRNMTKHEKRQKLDIEPCYFDVTICPKYAGILHYGCPKIFSVFFGGGPLAPVSYAYGWAPGPPPAKSGPESVQNTKWVCSPNS